MYLSRIRLNTARSETMRALAAPNIFHGAIESAELDKRTRKLWRVDELRGEKYLLILTEEPQDFSGVADQFGYDGCYEFKCYDEFLKRITDGSRWQFRLKANPTVQKYQPQKGRGRVYAHITAAHQQEWLKKQAEKNGFALGEEWAVTGSQWYIFKKNRYTNISVRMLAVTYEGILTVTNAEAFKKALINGIGREKAYGLGMMTVVGGIK